MLDINTIVVKYNKLIYKICYDMTNSLLDTEDIVQETFISFYNNMSRYENLDDIEIKNLICKIALNKCKDFLKSKNYRQSLMTMIDFEVLENYAEQNNIEEEIFKRQKDNLTKNAINRLKEPYRSLIYDYYINGFSLDEMVIKYKKRKNVIKTQIYRGKKKLKEIILSKGGINYYE